MPTRLKVERARTKKMIHQGDLHNFGQSVRAVAWGSGVYFQKPRPVYWEWLFFGQTSPLRPHFDVPAHNGRSISEYLFNLEVERQENYTGLSRQVVAAKINPASHHAYSLGILLAYSYVFGIRDLHRHNIIQTDKNLQVIDAEVVLVRLLLPHETLLLPFKDVGPDLAGISHLGANQAALPPDWVFQILEGYCDTFRRIIKNQTGISRVFREHSNEMAQVPIRHIARDTVHYRAWKTVAPKLPYFDHELRQLERGDVPYFFKFIGNPALYEYTDPSGKYSAVHAPKEFVRAIDRDATHPHELLESERTERNLFPTGLLFLAKQLLNSSFRGELKIGAIVLTKDADGISVLIENTQYQAQG